MSHNKSTMEDSGVNSLLKQSHEEPKSLCFPLPPSSEYWLLLSGLTLHGLLREYVLTQVHAKVGRAGSLASLSLLRWKPFPEVPPPIHWPGLSQNPDTNCRRGWKSGLNGIFSSFSGNRSQPSQRKSTQGRGREKGCHFVNYYGREVCHCAWQSFIWNQAIY